MIFYKDKDSVYLGCNKAFEAFADKIESITRTLYQKDNETEEHAERLKVFCKRIGTAVGLSELELNQLEIFALLHDIGKIGISESILIS